MKPGNLRLQGAKSGGGNREMREMQHVCAPSSRRSVFLMPVNPYFLFKKGTVIYESAKENFYF